MDKAAIMKEHQQAPAAPCNLHAVGKQHLGGRCMWCKQDGKVQEKKKYNINGGTDRRTSKFKKVWRVHHMECKRYSLKRGNIDRTKKYMNRNNPSIICVFFVFVLIFSESKVKCPAFLTQNVGYTDFHFSRGREFIHTKTGKSVGTLRLLRPTYHLLTLNPMTQSTNLLDWGRIKPAHTKMNNQIPHNCRKKWPGVSNSFFREGYLCLLFCYFTMVSDYDVQFDVGRGK